MYEIQITFYNQYGDEKKSETLRVVCHIDGRYEEFFKGTNRQLARSRDNLDLLTGLAVHSSLHKKLNL